MTKPFSSVTNLGDDDLLAEVARVAACERQTTAHLVALLLELDVRRLYLGQGYSSLFTYCTEALHLSEHAAYNRIQAARAARRFPAILERLIDGSIHLTAVRMLETYLTPDNHRDILDAARHKSKRAIEEMIARMHPKPDVPASIRKLPAPTPVKTCGAAPAVTLTPAIESVSPPEPAAVPASSQPAVVTPLAPERYKVQLTVSRTTYDKLRRAQDLMRHRIPNGDPASIFDAALTALLLQLERTKLAAAKRPRASTGGSPASRYIPAAVKRAVWARDGGCCAFVGAHGRCNETGFLEFHHRVPYAAGGETSEPNLELRCRSHNLYETERYFGCEWPFFARERCGAAWPGL